MSEIIEAEKNEIQPVNTGTEIAMSQPDRLLEIAISKGADMNQLEKLLDLKERYDNEQARKAFTAALAAFKSEELTIKKDKTVTIQPQDLSKASYGYKHATLGNIVSTAMPIMAKHGLSHRWEMQQADARVKVTCILTHSAGHSERVSLDGSPDDSGKKNGIQQVASTITYLERYTFLAITGLAVEEMDDDGASAGKPVELITEEQAMALHSRITDNSLNLEIFLKWAKVEKIEDIKVSNLDKMNKGIDNSIKAKKK